MDSQNGAREWTLCELHITVDSTELSQKFDQKTIFFIFFFSKIKFDSQLNWKGSKYDS